LSYLASLLSGGNREVVAAVLAKLIALRAFMRARNLNQPVDDGVLEKAGLDEAAAVRLYRLVTIGGTTSGTSSRPSRERSRIHMPARGRADSGF